MFCQKCGAVLEDGTKFCTNCGQKAENPAASEAVPATEATQEQMPVTEAASVQQATCEPQFVPAAQACAQMPPQPEKKPKKWLPIVIIAAVLVAAVVGALIAVPAIIDGLKEPGEYYAEIEYENILDKLDRVEENRVDFTDSKLESTLSVTLEQGAKDLIKGLGVDLDEYITGTKVTIDMDYTIKGDKTDMDLTLLLNDTDLLTVGMLVDMAAAEGYLDIPLLSPVPLSVSLEELDSEVTLDELRQTFGSYADMNTAVYGMLPFVEKYTKVAFDNIMPFEKEKAELTVGDLTAKYDLYTAHITNAQFAQMCLPVLQGLRDDADFRAALTSLLEAYAEMADEDATEALEEFYSEFDESIAACAEDAADETDTEVVMIYRVWMNGKEIMGREFKKPESEEDTPGVLGVYNVRVSGKQNTEILFDYGEICRFSGSAKRVGDLLTNGAYTFSYYDIDGEGGTVLDITVDRLDLGKLEENEYDMDITLTLGDAATALLDSEYAFLSDGSLKIVALGTAEQMTYTVEVWYTEKLLATVAVQSAVGEAEELTAPAGAIELDDSMLENFDIESAANTLLDRLKEAGVSAELIGVLRMAIKAGLGEVTVPSFGSDL